MFLDAKQEAYKVPITIGEFTYATDGCIILRIPAISSAVVANKFGVGGVDWSLCSGPVTPASGWYPIFAGNPSYQKPHDIVTYGSISLTAVKAFCLAMLPGPLYLRPSQDDNRQPIPFVFNGGCGFIMAAIKPLA